MTTLAYCGGFWGANIGNAFFNLGLLHALKTAKPDLHVTLIGEQPGWLWKYGRKPRASDVLIDDIECDYLAISGPVFNRWLSPIWASSFRKLMARGTKILVLSAGSYEYSREEFKSCLPLLEEYRPHVIMTRDADTFDTYSDLAEHSYNGICFAFFCSDYLTQPFGIDSEDIILNFDKGYDYNVLKEFGPDIIRMLDDGSWSPSGNHRPLKRDRSASQMATYDKYRIVRTYHEVAPPLWQKWLKSYLMGYGPFKRPNSYVADVPEGYLHLYKHAKLTISERVHACVMAAAFGNYAWLISKTKRARLFSRVGLDSITERPVRADIAALNEEKRGIIEFLRKVL